VGVRERERSAQQVEKRECESHGRERESEARGKKEGQ